MILSLKGHICPRLTFLHSSVYNMGIKPSSTVDGGKEIYFPYSRDEDGWLEPERSEPPGMGSEQETGGGQIWKTHLEESEESPRKEGSFLMERNEAGSK